MPTDALKVKSHRSNPKPREDAGVKSNRKRAPGIPLLLWKPKDPRDKPKERPSWEQLMFSQDAFFCLEKWEVEGWHEATLREELVIERKPRQ